MNAKTFMPEHGRQTIVLQEEDYRRNEWMNIAQHGRTGGNRRRIDGNNSGVPARQAMSRQQVHGRQ